MINEMNRIKKILIIVIYVFMFISCSSYQKTYFTGIVLQESSYFSNKSNKIESIDTNVITISSTLVRTKYGEDKGIIEELYDTKSGYAYVIHIDLPNTYFRSNYNTKEFKFSPTSTDLTNTDCYGDHQCESLFLQGEGFSYQFIYNDSLLVLENGFFEKHKLAFYDLLAKYSNSFPLEVIRSNKHGILRERVVSFEYIENVDINLPDKYEEAEQDW